MKMDFVKYNSNRDKRFMLDTVIYSDGDKKTVRKIASCPESSRFVSSIADAYAAMSGQYSNINICPCKKSDDDSQIDFDFAEGRSLFEIISGFAKDGNRKEYLDKLFLYRSIILDMDSLPIRQAYEITPEFTEIFGEYIGPFPFDYIEVSNIDFSFSNIILGSDGRFTAIDYEWSFDFPIPLNYILYRNLFFYNNDEPNPLFSLKNLIDFLDIPSQDIPVYHRMEEHFQRYVHGDNWQHYNRYTKPIRTLEQLKSSETALTADNDRMTRELVDTSNRLEQLIGTHKILKEQTNLERQHLQNQLAAKQNECDLLYIQVKSFQGAFWWRASKPARMMTGVIKAILHRIPGVRNLYKKLVYFRSVGYKTTSQKKRENDFMREILLSDKDRKLQEQTRFSKNIKFSILVPLYNTPKKYLHELVESLKKQTYPNWELCLADGSPDSQGPERQYRKYASADKRIRYKKIGENLGISGNTNKCIELATGEYVGLLDHDDILHPSALYEVMRVIEEQNADFIYTDEVTFEGDILNAVNIHFKPDFAIDNLRANNYICHFSCFKRTLLDKAGWYNPKYDGSQDYDITLRITEMAERIVHIPKVLYYWRAHANSVASNIDSKPYAIIAAKGAIGDHLERIGLEGDVEDSVLPSIYRIKYKIKGTPLVSIIIPNKDLYDDLRKCLNSIFRLTTYPEYEIIIAENNSSTPEIFAYYEELDRNDRINIVRWEDGFNYSAINNFAAQHAKGEYLIFLNNDTEIITPDWIEEMLMFAQRKDVGVVGVKLYYPDDTIQHAGTTLGLGGVAGHGHRLLPRNSPGYMGRLIYAQNVTAVTAACMMVAKDIFDQVGGFNEEFKVAFNDVDFCMKTRKAGYLNIFTPFCELYHYESKSRGHEDTPEKLIRFQGEIDLFKKIWGQEMQSGDPYYNPNLTLVNHDFSIG
ncbi:MAG: glycosyltransferase family 2 protein [Oscillospiraceae bacterium]|nr:glycosyltransferase family 2 protein [Oscillospiraceae bacterium]